MPALLAEQGVMVISPHSKDILKWSDKIKLCKGMKIFTDNKSSGKIPLSISVTLELGASTLVKVTNLVSGIPTELLLAKGRVRAHVSKDSIYISTLTSKVTVNTGFTDVILTNMNTLVAPREGKGAKVDTSTKQLFVDINMYALVTTEGDAVVSKAETTSNEENDDLEDDDLEEDDELIEDKNDSDNKNLKNETEK